MLGGRGTSGRPVTRLVNGNSEPPRPNLSSLLSSGFTARPLSSWNILLHGAMHGRHKILSMSPSPSCSLVGVWYVPLPLVITNPSSNSRQCGMLIESNSVRRCLNATVENMPVEIERHPGDTHKLHLPPRTYETSLNPMPALIILLLGVMMSSHHQASTVSTMVHKQWGNLLVGFAVARIGTYVLTYISPPTSIFPSRPPTELVSAFCLISGGLMFMASTKDIIHYMESADLMAMFVFTVVMGLTAFIMSYEIIVLSLKGWATEKARRTTPSSL